MIEAELPDGTILEFPADTPDSVVDSVVRQHMGVQAQPTEREWADVPAEAVSNVPASAMRLGESLYEAVTHPVETLDAITKIGAGALQLVLPEQLVNAIGKDEQSIDMARKVGQFMVDRYGSEEAVKETLATDPVGAAADVASVLTGGGAALKGVGMTKAGTALSKAGAAVEPVSAAVKGTAAATQKLFGTSGKVATAALGSTTGVGQDAIAEAYRTGAAAGAKGKAFRDALRGKIDPLDVVEEAKQALDNMRRTAADAYKKDMQAVKADKAQLSFDAIDNSIADNMGKFGKFKGVVRNKAAVDAIDEIKVIVDEWKAGNPADFHTPYGLDQLKQSIWGVVEKYSPTGKQASQTARMAANNIYHSVRDTIKKQAPIYDKTMREYAKAQDEINAITKELSLGKQTLEDTSLRKLLSVMRDNVNTNFGSRKKRVTSLEAAGAETLTPKIAGVEMQSVAPRGIQRATAALGAGGAASFGGLPAALAAAAASSPRLVGEVAHAAGRAAGTTSKAAKPAINLLEAIGQPELLNLLYQQERALQEQ